MFGIKIEWIPKMVFVLCDQTSNHCKIQNGTSISDGK